MHQHADYYKNINGTLSLSLKWNSTFVERKLCASHLNLHLVFPAVREGAASAVTHLLQNENRKMTHFSVYLFLFHTTEKKCRNPTGYKMYNKIFFMRCCQYIFSFLKPMM